MRVGQWGCTLGCNFGYTGYVTKNIMNGMCGLVGKPGHHLLIPTVLMRTEKIDITPQELLFT